MSDEDYSVLHSTPKLAVWCVNVRWRKLCSTFNANSGCLSRWSHMESIFSYIQCQNWLPCALISRGENSVLHSTQTAVVYRGDLTWRAFSPTLNAKIGCLARWYHKENSTPTEVVYRDDLTWRKFFLTFNANSGCPTRWSLSEKVIAPYKCWKT